MTSTGSSSYANSDGRLLASFAAFAKDIKIAHSVFALPFAISALVIGETGLPSVRQAALLLICMVTARSFAMGMNRFLDHEIDARNPRTKGRMIPAGKLAARHGLQWTAVAAAIFLLAAWFLSPLAGKCAPLLLMILASYSLLKRFTWATHWYLGVCLGLAPVAVNVALTGEAAAAVLCVGAAVALWTAGFDLLYALQDLDFDRAAKLNSVPARFGPSTTILISRANFVAMIALLVVAGRLAGMGLTYDLGVVAVAAMLTYEQWLVRDAAATGHSKNLGMAFFNTNAYVSVLFLAFVLVDRIVA